MSRYPFFTLQCEKFKNSLSPFFPDAYNEPVSFMTGSFDQQHPSHLSHHQDQYGAYGPYAVHPPLGSDSGGHRGIRCPFLGVGAFPQLPPGVTPWTPITIIWRLRPQLKPGTTMNVLKPLTINFHSVKFHEFSCHLDFTWNQFFGFKKGKLTQFNTFRGSEFSISWIFALFEG